MVVWTGFVHAVTVASLPPGADYFDRWLDVMVAATVVALVVQFLSHRNQVLVERLEAEAKVDGLTGLLNRRGFRERLPAELDRAQRDNVAISVVAFDLDRFKSVNDEFGHDVGDHVLVCLGRVLREQARASDLLVRMGGEEFVALLPDCGASEAGRFADRVRAACSHATGLEGPRVTVSAGVVAAVAPPGSTRCWCPPTARSTGRRMPATTGRWSWPPRPDATPRRTIRATSRCHLGDDQGMDAAVARTVWHRLEAINAVTYFSPECRDAPARLGLDGFWMGYFACRSAPMGAVGAGVVEATFFNFHPARVRRAIPDAWDRATPAAILDARSAAAASALRRLLGDAAAERLAAEVVSALEKVIDRAVPAGRPLFAANAALDRPTDSVGALFLAATTLREHRGDGHVALLTAAGLDGCEVHVLFAACEGVDPALYQQSRGWSPDDWAAAVDRLAIRGLLTEASAPTPTGQALRSEVEGRTDELAVAPYAALGDDGLAAPARRARPGGRPRRGGGGDHLPQPDGPAGVERVTGIEPASPAWKAGALPLSYTRGALDATRWRSRRTV